MVMFVFKLLNYFSHVMVLLDICIRWHQLPLAGQGASSKPTQGDRHRHRTRSQTQMERRCVV